MHIDIPIILSSYMTATRRLLPDLIKKEFNLSDFYYNNDWNQYSIIDGSERIKQRYLTELN